MRPLTSLLLMPSMVLAAADTQAMAPFRILPLDTKTGAALADLRPEELGVKVDGKARKVLRVAPFAPEVPVRWVLLFEPFQEARHRAVAFLAAAEFLRQIPDGDQALIIVRDKTGYRPLGPRFSLDRAAWSRQLAQVPGMLAEFLTSPVTPEGLKLGIEDAAVDQAADPAAGAKALQALVASIKKDPLAFAKGVVDTQTAPTLGTSASQSEVVRREMEAFPSVLDQLSALSGDKHLVVFSRNDADTFVRPDVASPRWVAKTLDTSKADSLSNSQERSVQPIIRVREALKERLRRTSLALHSVAGSGAHDPGFFGDVATSSGGQAFPVSNGLEVQLPGALLAYRNCLLVTLEGGLPETPAKVEVTCARPNVKVIAPRLR